MVRGEKMTSKISVVLIFGMVLMSLFATGCPGTKDGNGDTGLNGVVVNGAGASFPDPIYKAWGYGFEENSGMLLNYQSIGSGAGISAIQENTVNFGASDKPLTAEELQEYGLIQFPMIIGGVVPVVNIDGIEAGQLKLPGGVLADIFLGKITNWNDEAIMSANPGLNLPDKEIVVVRRGDGSGTTWIFTNYLAAVSQEWADTIGIGKSVNWPVGLGGRGNEGIASNVSDLDGTIGYVEYAYAIQNDLTYTLLENRSGNFIAPTAEAFQAAASNADWENAPGYYMVLVDQPGDESWPIVGASFILIYKEQKDMEVATAMLSFFDWCYRSGQDSAKLLEYVPIPENVYEMVEDTWRENVTVNGESVWKIKNQETSDNWAR